jgi:tetratricopeptide (TPR) repeat protein
MENAKLINMPSRSLAFNFATFFIIIIPLNILAQNSLIDSPSTQFYEREHSLLNIYNIDPQNEQNLIRMGELYASEKIWDLAIDSYEKLVDLDPDNPDYLYRLGGTQAAYSEVVSKFKVLSLINTAKRNLIKSASLDVEHIYSRWALVQILTELPQILGGNKENALIYCNEIQNISLIHGLISYHYYYSFQNNQDKITELETDIVNYIISTPSLFEFNYFNFVVGRLLATQNDKTTKLSIKYLETYLANYSSADRFNLYEVYYYLAYSNYKVGNTNSKFLIKRAKEAYENNQKKNPNLNKKIEELDKLIKP